MIAKKTVIAKIQQISVNEWLPALGINKKMLRKSKGMTRSSRVSVEFSVAYRLGHTMIPDTLAGFKVSDLFDGQVLILLYLCFCAFLALDCDVM